MFLVKLIPTIFLHKVLFFYGEILAFFIQFAQINNVFESAGFLEDTKKGWRICGCDEWSNGDPTIN